MTVWHNRHANGCAFRPGPALWNHQLILRNVGSKVSSKAHCSRSQESMGGCCSKDSAVHVGEPTKRAGHSYTDAVYNLAPLAGHKEQQAGAAEADAQSVQSNTPSSVKVAVMVRPMLPFEQQKGGSSSVMVYAPDKVVLPPLTQKKVAGGTDGAADFVYDRVYLAVNGAVGQQMYREMVQPVVERFCQGYNGCILAYGQTGSGKTYQMGGAASLQQDLSSSNSAAVLPQACAQLLDYTAGARDVYDVQLKVSYVEIYNEVIQDLLAPTTLASSGSNGNLVAARAVYGGSSSNGTGSGSNSPRRLTASNLEYGFGSSIGAGPSPLSLTASRSASDTADVSGGSSGGGNIVIYENAEGQIVLDGVTEVVLRSAADLASLLQRGSAVRATASHKLNQQSSRSHAILTLTLQQRAHAATARSLPQELRCLASKLHLVDLAGSERAKETGTTGQRFAEGVSINKGLLELGNVINALTEGASRKHIPYRNSKLTRLLQDSLGGNSETLFIACISPSDTNRDHTLSTLRYASRAMSIKNSLHRSVMGPAEELAYLKELVSQLQEENAQLKQVISDAGLQSASAAAAMPQKGLPGRAESVCELYVKAC